MPCVLPHRFLWWTILSPFTFSVTEAWVEMSALFQIHAWATKWLRFIGNPLWLQSSSKKGFWSNLVQCYPAPGLHAHERGGCFLFFFFFPTTAMLVPQRQGLPMTLLITKGIMAGTILDLQMLNLTITRICGITSRLSSLIFLSQLCCLTYCVLNEKDVKLNCVIRYLGMETNRRREQLENYVGTDSVKKGPRTSVPYGLSCSIPLLSNAY